MFSKKIQHDSTTLKKFYTVQVVTSLLGTWWSGYCYLNKGECDLNQSKDDSFVERVAKINSRNNGVRHKIHYIFLVNCFVFVFFFRYNSSLANSAQFCNDSNYSKFNGENIATNCSRATVFALDGLTKKHFGLEAGHYAVENFFPQITKYENG